MKLPVPKSKFQRSFNPQFARGGNVRFGVSLELGTWSLEFKK
jgi:hypothetical protein